MCTIEHKTGGVVPNGQYWLKLYDGRLYSTVIKVLNKIEVRTANYNYSLFRNGEGFAIRRKDRHISEQEQTWEDVAEIWPE